MSGKVMAIFGGIFIILGIFLGMFFGSNFFYCITNWQSWCVLSSMPFFVGIILLIIGILLLILGLKRI